MPLFLDFAKAFDRVRGCFAANVLAAACALEGNALILNSAWTRQVRHVAVQGVMSHQEVDRVSLVPQGGAFAPTDSLAHHRQDNPQGHPGDWTSSRSSASMK